jgi:hypothetical protein
MGLPGEELVLLASAIAISISKDLSKSEIALLASLLSTIAGDLFLIAAKRAEEEPEQAGDAVLFRTSE